MSELKLKSFEIRKDVLKMIYDAKTGHTGSDLSCADILVALYYGVLNVNPENPEALDVIVTFKVKDMLSKFFGQF